MPSEVCVFVMQEIEKYGLKVITYMCHGIYRVVHKCWSVKGDTESTVFEFVQWCIVLY